MPVAQGASWVLGMGRELDGKPGTAKKFDKNQKFIGDICEFQMWNRGFFDDSAAKRFFKNPYSIGRPTLFDYPISYRYTLKNGAKAKMPLRPFSKLDKDKNAIVALHNRYRSEVKPAAIDMKPMYWDDGLATLAQKWADTCVYKHGHPRDKKDTIGPKGQPFKGSWIG